MFTFSPLPHDEAARRIAELPLVSREVMDEMLPELKAYAFTITGLDVGDQMAKVRDTLAAVPKGEVNWDKARAEIAADLANDLGGKASERRAELLEANDPISAVVTGFINEAVGSGALELRGLTPEQMSVGLWALTIGTHNLVHAEGVMADLEVANPYRLYCRHLQTMLNGYGWKPLAEVADDAALDALIERISREVFPELCGDCGAGR